MDLKNENNLTEIKSDSECSESSSQNAEIIAAAFATSSSASSSTSSSNNTLKQSNNFDIPIKSKTDENDSDDSLTDTIAKVASGSISSDTTKIIEAKQMSMIKYARIQEEKFLKMKKNEEDTQEDVDEEDEGEEDFKKKRHRRTKLEILRDNAKAAAAADAAVASLLSSITESATSSNNPKFRHRKKLIKSSLSSIDNSLKSRKFKLIHKDIQRKRAFNSTQTQNNLKPIEIKTNDIKQEDQNLELFERKCLICKLKIDQDSLNDHYSKHYSDSPKCCNCDKISTNPANFVTHVLTHLPSQFFCKKCDIWFRQPIVYRRHKTECDQKEVKESLNVNTRLKRKSSVDSVVQIDIKRRRRTRARIEPLLKKSVIKPEDLPKRRPGRPPKHIPSHSKIDDTEEDQDEDIEAEEVQNAQKAQKHEKRKYERQIRKPDLSKKQRLRSFTNIKKYNENFNFSEKTKPIDEQDSEYEDIPIEEKSSQVKTVQEDDIEDQSDDIDDIIVSDIELDDDIETASETNTITETQPHSSSVLSLPTLSSLISKQQIDSIISNGGGGTLANAIASLALKPSKDLSMIGTYKVKIQPRQVDKSETPLKPQLPKTTPISNSTDQAQTTYFECPECDKKFVSYFGLIQHYDQHPTLAVSCSKCDLTFENHHSLVLHNASVHQIIDTCLSLAKDKEKFTIAQVSSKKQLQSKLKSQTEDSTPADSTLADLSALPSIMTRTSRQTTSILNKSILNSSAQSKPSLISSLALSNHNLSVKTSGFADLSFIDFSCINFPRIAQNYCELWPRKQQTQSNELLLLQPLHNYKCDSCGFYFPCIAALKLHKIKNKKSHCKLFMTNSKLSDYEKTIDELITKIEKEESGELSKDEFLGLFNLVDAKELAKPVSNKPRNASNQHESLLLDLRSQMLDINHQFIVDLDKWKYIHSIESITQGDYFDSMQYSNKIHLKPHVNLNRPLLIRSKKLKRKAQKFLLQSANKHPVSIIGTQINAKTTTFSKPYFTSTSGNFSAATSNLNKKRKFLEQKIAPQVDLMAHKKRRQKAADLSSEDTNGFNVEEEEDEPRRLTRQNVSQKRIKSEESSMDNYDEEFEDEQDTEHFNGDINEFYDNLKKQPLIQTFKKKPIIKRLQQPPKLIKAPPYTTDQFQASKTPIYNLPAPPPLYRAPSLQNSHFTSANSSRLASASGMNSSLPLIMKTMPKLQPINVLTKIEPSMSIPPPIMPKLILHNPENKQSKPVVNQQNSFKTIAPRPSLVSPEIGSNKDTSSLVKMKNSENISLKCKFCMQIFKGQSEFFQHVIMSHPKMVKQRLNRGSGQSGQNSSSAASHSYLN